MSLLRDRRTEFDYSMKELGKLVGVSEASISLYELKKRYPSYETLLRLSEELNLPVSDLVLDLLDLPLGQKAESEEELSNIKDIYTYKAAAGFKRLTEDQTEQAYAMLHVMFPEVFV